ncbi:hypothetical protein LWI29_001575 [Acer saccharum]|uniref:Uncharacterized protein n=1 Tax=Acer saccharum TaxID=4024 RepID=A0AA39W6D1_ACESA|nr:hypothetical protein LWI29_001575 [Acer saccharum]
MSPDYLKRITGVFSKLLLQPKTHDFVEVSAAKGCQSDFRFNFEEYSDTAPHCPSTRHVLSLFNITALGYLEEITSDLTVILYFSSSVPAQTICLAYWGQAGARPKFIFLYVSMEIDRRLYFGAEYFKKIFQ